MIVSERDAADADAALKGDKRAWYVEAFLAFGGWIAGLFAASAIFAAVAAMFADFEHPRGAALTVLAIGASVAVVGVAIGRRRRSEFTRHFAIAGIAAGFTAATAAVWYLAWDWLASFFAPGGDLDGDRVGAAGLIASAVLALAGFFATRAVRDGILTFLVTLAWFAVMSLSVSMLYAEQSVSRVAFDALPSAAALAGLALFTRPIGRSAAAAAGAALMIGPMLFLENIRRGFGFLGVENSAPASGLSEILFALAILYCLWTLRGRFPALGLAGGAALLLAGSYLLPDAGSAAIVILLAGFAASHRGLAAVGVVALAWFIGRYYYDLSLTLIEKSAILSGLGLATLAVALGSRRLFGSSEAKAAAPDRAAGGRRGLVATLAFGALLLGSLLLVNRQVLDLEAAFKETRRIYLPLGPVDPRSLIQGDYMVLNFRETVYPQPEAAAALPRSGEVFLKLDADAVAEFSRIAGPGDEPRPDEIRVDYAKAFDGGQIRYCPASFFFQEGDAEAYNAARFAVLDVADDGRVRLVDLADENRRIIDPAATRPGARADQ
jgi:uncharacterized membrane-anchored protein